LPATTHLTLETVDFDYREEVHAFIQQVITAGMITINANVAKLQAMGLMDSEGNSLSTELPEDMREGSERDFGG
jgi:hypothetical protein